MKKLDDLKKKRIKDAYVVFRGPDTAFLKSLNEDLRISSGTLKRLKKEHGWGAMREGAIAGAEKIAEEKQALSTSLEADGIDPTALLLKAIVILADAIPNAPAKSKEGCVTAMLRAIEVYRKFRPLTVCELADLAMTTPGYTPQEFVKELRRRLNEAR
ncbi:hypothetical protein ACQ4M4_27385 [Leptolyngbya sp. AN02str]|uniref:hypothetical protein n=1 Tax=Leptolyngbya sp. AN02str TaxID=3423363 RepID=UPI003D32267D